MGLSFCQGCECTTEKSVPPVSFSNCRTRHTGGIAGIIITCDSDAHAISENTNYPNANDWVDFSEVDPVALSHDIWLYFNQHVDNTHPLINIPFEDSDEDGIHDGPLPNYHYWCVDADLPETEDELEELSFCGSESVIDRAHKVVGDILDVNLVNYDMMRYYQALDKARIWFITASGQLYGGQSGISVNITKFNYVISRGTSDPQRITFEFKWRCLKQPKRIELPTWNLPMPSFV